MANLVKHGDWSDEQVERDAEEGSKSSTSFLSKLPEGDSTLRFLPPKVGKMSPLAQAYEHWMNRPDGSRCRLPCPRMMAKTFCPICQKMDKLKASKSAADQKAGKKLYPKLRVYANVVDRDNEAKGVQVFAFGKTIYDGLMSIRRNPKKGGRFTDPENGRDLIITRKGTGQFDTEYSVAASMEASPLHPDPGQVDEWMEQAYDLDGYLTVLSPEEMLAKLRGEEGDGEDDEAAPAARRPAARAAPAARQATSRAQNVGDDAVTFDPSEFE